MIGTIFWISAQRLWNNKQELFLTLVVPILFFSIFALIFGRGIGGERTKIRVAVIDDDRTAISMRIVESLGEQSGVELENHILSTNPQWSLENLSKALIQDHACDLVVHLPLNLTANLKAHRDLAIPVITDGTNPIGLQVVRSMLTNIVLTAAAAPPPRQAISDITRLPPTRNEADPSDAPLAAAAPTMDTVSFPTTDIYAAGKHNPKVAMYAAGIAVMFLLFSATGAGGSLLEENEAGTLDRLLSSRLSISQLLAGKWLYITCLGCTQLLVMFVWAQIAFGVNLREHWLGFLVMTVSTAAATASFALCLSALCHSRAQLNGVSIVLILSMSALGGSMVPRYIMSEEMQRWGQITFNAWALDGFKKVFWHDLPASALGTEVQVLLAMAVGLACIARLCADRWDVN